MSITKTECKKLSEKSFISLQEFDLNSENPQINKNNGLEIHINQRKTMDNDEEYPEIIDMNKKISTQEDYEARKKAILEWYKNRKNLHKLEIPKRRGYSEPKT